MDQTVDQALQWVAASLGIIGAVYVGRKIKIGFIYWIISSIIFVILTAIKGDWGFMTLQAIYVVVSIRNWFAWKNMEG